MSGVKREQWTEADVLALPAGEQDFFDRKSGQLLSEPHYRRDLAKALSAFANSGGGYLVLGIMDDGTLDGLPEIHKGRTRTRDWLEQVIPMLVHYPLQDFRVHEVEPAIPSLLPAGRIAIVIDIGDSVLAPHQAVDTKVYYYRAGGRSEPAPHFYLETLRNRLIGATLEARLHECQIVRAQSHQSGVFVHAHLVFRIRNTGRIAAYKWALVFEGIANIPDERGSDVAVNSEQFPQVPGGFGSIRLDDTILPGLHAVERKHVGLYLHPRSTDPADLHADLASLLAPNSTLIRYRVVSETSPGEAVETPLGSILDLPMIARQISELLPTG